MKASGLIFAVGLFALSCKGTGEETVFIVPPDYHSWKKPVKEVLDYTVPGHGKSIRIIYSNSKAYERYTIKDARGGTRILSPDGSVIIKEVYDNKKDVGKKEPVLDIMVKQTGARGSIDGWLYYMKKADGPMLLVTGRLCVGCHEAANEMHPYFDKNGKGIFRDYLFHPHR